MGQGNDWRWGWDQNPELTVRVPAACAWGHTQDLSSRWDRGPWPWVAFHFLPCMARSLLPFPPHWHHPESREGNNHPRAFSQADGSSLTGPPCVPRPGEPSGAFLFPAVVTNGIHPGCCPRVLCCGVTVPPTLRLEFKSPRKGVRRALRGDRIKGGLSPTVLFPSLQERVRNQGSGFLMKKQNKTKR